MPEAPFKMDNSYIRLPHCFWIECNWPAAQNICEQFQIPLLALDDPEDHREFCFIITADLTHISQSFRVFPRSAMNCDKEDYIKLNVDIDDLSKLKIIYKELLNQKKIKL